MQTYRIIMYQNGSNVPFDCFLLTLIQTKKILRVWPESEQLFNLEILYNTVTMIFVLIV